MTFAVLLLIPALKPVGCTVHFTYYYSSFFSWLQPFFDTVLFSHPGCCPRVNPFLVDKSLLFCENRGKPSFLFLRNLFFLQWVRYPPVNRVFARPGAPI